MRLCDGLREKLVALTLVGGFGNIGLLMALLITPEGALGSLGGLADEDDDVVIIGLLMLLLLLLDP